MKTQIEHILQITPKVISILFGFLFLAFVSFTPAFGQNLSIEIIAAPNLVSDSNKPAEGPDSATIAAEVCNTGGTNLNEVYIYIGDYQGSVASSTPGIYPNGLTHEGGSAGTDDATRFMATLAAGACTVQYWVIGYNPFAAGTTPSFDVWAHSTSGGTPANLVDATHTFKILSQLSASANKIWPNGDNKVPDEYVAAIEAAIGWDASTPLGEGTAYPGDIINLQGIWYDVGVVNMGFDNDGDGVRDYNAWLQPIGDASKFDAGCFRLIRVYGLIIVKLKTGGEYLIPFENQLYFTNLPENTGVVGLVYYEYAAIDGACDTYLTPFQEAASGKDVEKYTADFGRLVGVSSYNPHIAIDKQAPASTSTNSNITYTLEVNNTGPVDAGLPEYGIPIVIHDSIPTGTTYVASTATNSFTLSGGGNIATTVLYSTDNGTTWTSTEPSASSVTDIRWWLQGALPAGASGTVKFDVNIPSGYADSFVSNTGAIGFGEPTDVDEDTATTFIEGTNEISGTVFLDNGAGGGNFGDGTQDGSEGGISSVTVELYIGGVKWSPDEVTSGAGDYSFTNLPDGTFTVKIKTDDTDLPVGAGATTVTEYQVTLVGPNASGTGNHFGFAPPLTIEKTADPTSVSEGDSVVYTITLTNHLQDPGGGGGGVCTYDVYASNLRSTKGNMDNPSNSVMTGEPEGSTASSNLQGNDKMEIDTFIIAPLAETITKIEAITKAYSTSALVNDEVIFTLNYNTFTRVQTYSSNFPSGSLTELTWDVTSFLPLDWATFSNTSLYFEIEAKKVNDSDGGIAHIDAVGFRITTDCGGGSGTFDLDTTLNPVPLTDTFDDTYLEFISADITPSSVSAGTITWDNVGPLNAGTSKEIVVNFEIKVLSGAANITAPTDTINTASTSNVKFASGETANDDSDTATVTINPKGSISGVLWSEESSGTTGWVSTTGYEANDWRISGVNLELFACSVDGTTTNLFTGSLSSKACGGGGTGTSGWVSITTTITDNQGSYVFSGLDNGYYYVQVISGLPSGATQAAEANDDQTAGGQTCGACDNTWGGASENLNTSFFNPIDTVGEDITDVSFGYSTAARLYGVVWEDHDGDGVKDTGEEGISGITVDLSNGSSVTTASDGSYIFDGLVAGNYTILIENGSGITSYTQTVDPDSTLDHKYTLAITTGDFSGSHDFAYRKTGTASLGDLVYYDWDADGIYESADGEEGIPNVTINLYVWNDDGNDTFETGELGAFREQVDTSAVTATLGEYTFSNLPDGDFVVVVDTGDIVAYARQTQDPDEVDVCSICDSTAYIANLTGSKTDVDFGYTLYGDGSIGDLVWRDMNGDQAQAGTSEVGIGNVVVTLEYDFGSDGSYTQIASINTDTNTATLGSYLFDNLPPGDYQVKVDDSQAAIPEDTLNNTYLATTSVTYSKTISCSTSPASDCSNHTDADFGFAPPVSIGDTIYWDANGNGDMDFSEEGIANVTVQLYSFTDTNSNETYDAGVDSLGGQITSTITADGSGSDPIGYYKFTGLAAGNYVVQVDTGTGSPVESSTLTADPNADGLPCHVEPQLSDPYYNDPTTGVCDDAFGLTVNLGANFIGADFGYLPSGIVGDYVWLDINGDGIQDSGEQGIGNVKILLRDPTDTSTIKSISTDNDGYYTFDNISNGTYIVKVDTTDTATQTALASKTPTVDFDGDTNNDESVQITLSGGVITSIGGNSCTDCDLNVDFGYTIIGTYNLSGTVCLETGTSDGICGGIDDIAQSNLIITLYDNDGNELGTATTDSNGFYEFTNLPDGPAPYDSYRLLKHTILPPFDTATFTTTAAVTPASSIDISSSGLWVRQNVPLNGSSQTDVDFAFAPQDYDYGDLPSSYSITTLSDSPSSASHNAGSLYLGSSIDEETNGQESANADGDNNNDTDDEDGVSAVNIENWTDGTNGGTVSVTTSGSGYLVAWIDFDNDGDFSSFNENIISQNVSAGTQNISFDIPIGGTTEAQLFARFRLFESAPLIPSVAYTGHAENGEVEDYKFALTKYDYGDAPDSYGGARHSISAMPIVYLGTTPPDEEADTLLGGDAGAGADGDDGDSTDDEDAFTSLPNLSTADTSYSLTVPCAGTGTVAGWIDFDLSGTFTNNSPNERASGSCDGTDATLTWNSASSNFPASLSVNTTYVRLRVATKATEVDSPTGIANDGEVEDYELTIEPVDYGDAPDTTNGTGISDYQTLRANGGPSHILDSNIYMGSVAPDADTDAFGNGTDTSGGATDDDTVDDPIGGVDDEDTFTTFPSLSTTSTSYTLSSVPVVNNTGKTAYLVGWIDFNGDGDFTDADIGEQSNIAVIPDTGTSADLNWLNLSGLVAGTTYARFRISTDSSLNLTPSPTGTLPDGEVEDYPITIGSQAVLGVAKTIGNVTDNQDGSYNVPFTITVENLGTEDLSDLQVTDDLTQTFPDATTYTITTAPTPISPAPGATGALSVNSNFNGGDATAGGATSGDTNLLQGTDNLAVGETKSLGFVIRIIQADPNKTYFNQAFGEANSGAVTDPSPQWNRPRSRW